MTLPRAAPRLLLIPHALSKTPLSSLQLHCRPLPATLPASAWNLTLVVNLTRRPPIRLPSSGRFSTRLVLFSVQLEEAAVKFLLMGRQGSMVWHPRAIPVSLFLTVCLSLINTPRTATLLSLIMSEYFEAQKRDPQACSFAGNGTVNPNASSSSNASAAASSCLASVTGAQVPVKYLETR